MMTNRIAIQTCDLTKRYKAITAVDKISFDVRVGEVFGFLGPNGAGKTTTIAMLLGLVRPSSGSAEVLGFNIQSDLTSSLRRVGAIVETPAFYPYMTGFDNLRIFARIIGSNAERQIPAILDRVGLNERQDDKVGTYSLGMRQRLGLASALLGDPQLLILDEPTNGLDPAGMQEMRGFLRQLAEQEGKTVFLSSHLLHEVEQVCDRVLILNQGRVIAQGDVTELLSQAYGIELRIANVERALEAISKIDWVGEVYRVEGEITADAAETAGGWLSIQAPPERAPEMLAVLAKEGIFPFEVRPVISSLESVFLSLTDNSRDRDTDDA